MHPPNPENARSRPGGGGFGEAVDLPWQVIEQHHTEGLHLLQAARIAQQFRLTASVANVIADLHFRRAA